LLITDHHEITAGVPNSFALINPKNPADTYPDPQITGVGVAYKLARALLREKAKVIRSRGVAAEEFQEHWDKWLLDLVAIGTVADCHSLLGENRILVKYGLLVLAKTKWPGLRALLSVVNPKNEIVFDTHLLGFNLAPRINAAGRLEHANIALDTLLARDPVVAGQAAQVLERINQKRRDITARLISEAREQALLQQQHRVLVLASPDWPKGVVGIAAGQLAGEFGKPVIVLELGPEEATGSARTYGGFNVVEALKATSSFLTRFGGHKEAAGLTLPSADVDAFRAALITYAEQVFTQSPPEDPPLEIDAVLEAEQLTLDFFDIVEELAPFGAGNTKPLWWLREASLEQMKPVGTEGKHLQLTLSVAGVRVQAIAFSQGFLASTIPLGSSVEVAAELLADSWNGVRKLKLRVLDLKLLTHTT
jgi:single-stranded-DNA-specific exonuclease